MGGVDALFGDGKKWVRQTRRWIIVNDPSLSICVGSYHKIHKAVSLRSMDSRMWRTHTENMHASAGWTSPKQSLRCFAENFLTSGVELVSFALVRNLFLPTSLQLFYSHLVRLKLKLCLTVLKPLHKRQTYRGICKYIITYRMYICNIYIYIIYIYTYICKVYNIRMHVIYALWYT